MYIRPCGMGKGPDWRPHSMAPGPGGADPALVKKELIILKYQECSWRI